MFLAGQANAFPAGLRRQRRIAASLQKVSSVYSYVLILAQHKKRCHEANS
jgi:hypothetical protein